MIMLQLLYGENWLNDLFRLFYLYVDNHILMFNHYSVLFLPNIYSMSYISHSLISRTRIYIITI